MSFSGYKVLETDIGPMISDSRTSVYDVLLNGAKCLIHTFG